MKKIGLVGIVILSSSYLYNMELSISYLYGKTKITVMQGSPCDVDGRVDSIVYEKNAQQWQREMLADNWLVGDTHISHNKIVYVCNKDDDSDSDDDNYSFCYNNMIKKPQENMFKKCLQSMGIEVVEPLIFINQYSGEYYYYAEKLVTKGKGYPCGTKYFGNEAIEQASNDLDLCYNQVLNTGLRMFRAKKDKSIALPALGTAVNFPRGKAALVAVPAILKFIKNNPNAYSSIELFVEKQFECAFYETLLNFYVQ